VASHDWENGPFECAEVRLLSLLGLIDAPEGNTIPSNLIPKRVYRVWLLREALSRGEMGGGLADVATLGGRSRFTEPAEAMSPWSQGYLLKKTFAL